MAQEALNKTAKKLESEFWKELMEGKSPSLEPKPTELSQYNPPLREMIAAALKGNSYGESTERLVDNLLGTNSADIGLLDATPVGALMRAWEGANKVVKSDDPYERASGAVDMLPGGVLDRAVLLPIAAASRFGWKKFEKVQDLAHQIGAYLMDKNWGDRFPGIGDKYMDELKKSKYVKSGMISRHPGAKGTVVVEVPDFGLDEVNKPGKQMEHPSIPTKFYTDTLGVELPMYVTKDLDGAYGSFNFNKNTVNTDLMLPKEDLASTLAHEFQHFNDEATGLPAGGSPDFAAELQHWAKTKGKNTDLAQYVNTEELPYNIYKAFGGEIASNTTGHRLDSAKTVGSIKDIRESIYKGFAKLQDKLQETDLPFSVIADDYDALQSLLPKRMSETAGYFSYPNYRSTFSGKAIPIANKGKQTGLWSEADLKFSEKENMRAILELMSLQK